jgi:O-antigen ligase
MSMAQVAQWALFALSAGIYWLMANLVKGEKTLRRLTFLFLGLNGILIGPSVLSRGQIDLEPITTLAFSRAPLWALVAALALGQLLFNQRLNLFWRLFLGITFFTVVLSTFWFQRQAASRWIGVAAVIGVLFWLRWPRWRLPTLVLLVILIITGSLTSSLYEFAGGDAEWIESGGSRLVLITRVIEVTLYNPITGLGPASYRAYAGMEPIQYGRALWVNPLVNSHNNYVDLFAHTGLLGLGLFLWFMAEVTLLGWRLSRTYRSGFLGGYVSAMTATCISSLVLMLLADWILPFIYNVGYSGFQASALVWFFLGGLVTVENLAETKTGSMESDETVDNHR